MISFLLDNEEQSNLKSEVKLIWFGKWKNGENDEIT